MNLKQLRDRRAKVIEDGKAAVAIYTSEGREPTEDELAKVKDFAAQRQDLDNQIKAAEERADLERGFEAVDTVTVSPGAGDVRITGGAPRIADDPRAGFKTFREFAQNLIRYRADEAGNVRVQISDDRMRYLAAPTTVTNESSGADGGFLVPPEFSSEIFATAFADDSLMGSVREIPVSGNGMTFPSSETTPWGTSGAQVYWEGENVQATQSKAAFKLQSMRLKKLLGLIPITDELAADAPAAAAWVENEIAPAIRFKVNDAFLHGSGVEGPLGVVGHAGTVQVNAVSGQNGATVVYENVLGMYERAINPMRSTWIANISVMRHLHDMKDDSGNRIYQTTTPGLTGAPVPMLLGQPVRYVEACKAVGTVGDLVFGDWGQYVAITKGGIATDTSMHLWFDYDTLAFRARFRIDGQPWRSTTLSPAYGSNTRGNFVTLETRS